MTKFIKQAVIPAAGLGTHFLPSTKAIPKELIPLAGKPCLQHVIDEALAAGVEEFIIVVSPHKKHLFDYFQPQPTLDDWLIKRGLTDALNEIKKIESQAKISFVVQEEPLGLGHAILCTQELVKDDHFFVLLPDDVIDADTPVCLQMLEAFEKNQHPLVAVMSVNWEDVGRYGIVGAIPLSERLGKVESIIEKPKRENSPSNLAVIGRYILPKTIFPILKNVQPGAGAEIQLTDALQQYTSEQSLYSFTFEGERHDIGTPLGFLQASVSLSLKNSKLQNAMQNFIKNLATGL